MTFIRKIRLLFTPYWQLVQQHDLLLKSARRCAYDMRHASDFIPVSAGNELFGAKFYRERANMWLGIFTPDGIKNYQHELFNRISELERELERTRALLAKNGIEDTSRDIPF